MTPNYSKLLDRALRGSLGPWDLLGAIYPAARLPEGLIPPLHVPRRPREKARGAPRPASAAEILDKEILFISQMAGEGVRWPVQCPAGRGPSRGAAALVPRGPSPSQRDCANSQLWELSSPRISALHFAPRLR